MIRTICRRILKKLEELELLDEEILKELKNRSRVKLILTINLKNIKITSMSTIGLTLSLNTLQEAILSISGQDTNGGPATLTNVVFSIDNTAVASITADSTGLNATVVPITTGTVNVTVSASDASGNAISPATAILTITPDLAVSLTLTGVVQAIPVVTPTA